MPKVLGNVGDDSLLHEANPDQPHVGGVNPSLFTGGALIPDELSALSLPDTDPSPDSAFLSVTFKMTTKNNNFFLQFFCLFAYYFLKVRLYHSSKS